MREWLERFLRQGGARAHPPAVATTVPRPDIIDLIGEGYDRVPTTPARRTLVICAAPRAGSYEVSRLLTAAGLGVPHEYFNPQFAQMLAARWSIDGDPLAEGRIGGYVDVLRRRRATGDVFATKLQFWHFDQFLRNKHGEALFRDAHVVHLFRPDVAAQFASYRKARITGRWDFSQRLSSEPRVDGPGEAMDALDRLIAEDAGFRRLFALLGIDPLFLTLEDVSKRPREVVDAIARLLDLPVDRSNLDRMLAASTAYPHDRRSPAPAQFAETFRTRAFSNWRST